MARQALGSASCLIVGSLVAALATACQPTADSEPDALQTVFLEASDVRIVGTTEALAVVQDLEVLPDGRIWVQNSVPPFFVGFGSNGEVVGVHGEAGGGPEEFMQPAGFVVGALGEEAWVLDVRRHGLVRVSRPDESWMEVRLPRADLPPGTVKAGLDLLAPLVRTARFGETVVLPRSTGTLESGVFTLIEAILKADLMALDPASGELARILSIGDHVEDPFPDFNPTEGGFPLWKRLWAVCGEHLRVYDRVRNQLRGFDETGAEVAPVRLPRTGLAQVAPEDFARVVFPLRQAEVTGGVGDRLSSEDSLRLVSHLAHEVKGTAADLAAYLPPFVDFRCSPRGTMWLRPIDLAGAGLRGGRVWLRVGSTGAITVVHLPPRFDALRFTDDRVFGALRDELDIPSVAWVQLPVG